MAYSQQLILARIDSGDRLTSYQRVITSIAKGRQLYFCVPDIEPNIPCLHRPTTMEYYRQILIETGKTIHHSTFN